MTARNLITGMRPTTFGDEAFLTEALGEWSQSSRLYAADAVGHHHSRVRPGSFGEVQPSLQLVTGSRRDPYRGAGRNGGIVLQICHRGFFSPREAGVQLLADRRRDAAVDAKR